MECVTRLAAAAAADPLQPDPVNYLLQHSAGSGKSLTIAALVLALTQLVSRRPAVSNGSPGQSKGHTCSHQNAA